MTLFLEIRELVGAVYANPGATAKNDVNGDISGQIVVGGDTVDTSAPGSFTVTYNVSDAAGNPAAQVTRTVEACCCGASTTPPVITLLGSDPLELTVGAVYANPGATAIDDVDGDISGLIVVGGDTVDTSAPGSFTVTYNVSDAAGNPAAQVTRTVNVSAAPDTTPGDHTSGERSVGVDGWCGVCESGCDGQRRCEW